MHKTFLFFLIVFIQASTIFDVSACTNFIVTKGASKDGSVMVVYTCDGEFHPRLRVVEAADYKPGEMLEIKDWSGNVLGAIKQVLHTYAIVGPHMNEHQVSIGETTFGGRAELVNSSNLLHYWTLMQLALKRSKTALEAVKVMTELAEEYGFNCEGESFSIADANEVWILEMAGTGEDGKGAVWVARKVPDGYISAHANKSRIGEFPLDDPENCLYSKNVISLAIEKGYYKPESGEPFRFNEAYDPSNPSNLRYCESRVWSMFNRCAPSLELSTDYHRGVVGAERYPLWIKPDSKLDVKAVSYLIRDHYEGTAFDMTKGIEAGPFGSPNRCRPLVLESDGKTAVWERPISTRNTAFSFIAQSRSWLPNEIGGVLWYGYDDTYYTCYTPVYSCTKEISKIWGQGTLQKFSWDSAWWRFNFVSNYSDLRYSDMIKDIQKVQRELEDKFYAYIPAIDKAAGELYKIDPKLAAGFLSDFSNDQLDLVAERWLELAEHLITKYNDGYIKDEKGRAETVGYSQEWINKVIQDNSSHLLPVWKKGKAIEPIHY
ncbi:dipeptidase [Ancylomarina sp. YFZ004]